jgi:MFS family permease
LVHSPEAENRGVAGRVPVLDRGILKTAAELAVAVPSRLTKGWQLTLLMSVGFGGIFALSALGPLQETMTHALSLSDNEMALLVGPAMSLPTLLLMLPIGFAIDHYSRARLLLVCAVLSAIGSVLTALAPNLVVLFIARAAVGVAVTAMTIATYSLLADYFAPQQRGRAKAAVVLGQYTGKSAAFALGGVLLALYGPGADGWRQAMLWLSIPPTIVCFIALILREAPRTGTVVSNPSLKQTLGEIWRFRAVIGPLTLGVAIVDFPFVAALTWAAPVFARNFSLSPDKVGGIIATILMVSGLCGPVIGGTLADWCQRAGRTRRNMLVLGLLMLISVPASLFAVVTDVTLATALLLLFVISSGASLSMGLTLFTVIVPNELRGVCLSVLTMINLAFAGAVSPLAVSVLSGAMGGPTMLGKALTITCAVAGLISAAIFAFASRTVSQAREAGGLLREQSSVY